MPKRAAGHVDLDPPLDIRLTSTDLNGKVVSIADGKSVMQSVDHSVEFRFTDEDFHFASHPQASARVARACGRRPRSQARSRRARWPKGSTRHGTHRRSLSTESVGPAFLVDGGVLNNLPARNVVDAIVAQPAGERVNRYIALVVPDPVMRPDEKPKEPLFIEKTIAQSSVSIPRNQSLSGFLTEVRDHNNDVCSRRAARARSSVSWVSSTRPRRGRSSSR